MINSTTVPPSYSANIPQTVTTVKTVTTVVKQEIDVVTTPAQVLTVAGRIGNISLDASDIKNAAGSNRKLADELADFISIEDFGAIGDGITDNTAAFNTAIASGRPLRLSDRTYVVNGPLYVSGAMTIWTGIEGGSRITRTVANSGSWIEFQATLVRLSGITFRANPALTSTSWGVVVTSTVTDLVVDSCRFSGNTGPLAKGLAVLGAIDSNPRVYDIRNSRFLSNASDGLFFVEAVNFTVSGCHSHDNGGNGFSLQLFGATSSSNFNLRQKITANRSWNNAGCGILTNGFVIGTYGGSILYGFDPVANFAVVISDNTCWDNGQYGIIAFGDYFDISGNQCTRTLTTSAPSVGGIDATVRYSRVHDNTVNMVGAGWGIDTGGACYTQVSDNNITGVAIGLNIGGSSGVLAAGNTVSGTTYAINVNNCEADGSHNSFPTTTTKFCVENNHILITASNQTGVRVADNAQGVVTNNRFVGFSGTTVQQAMIVLSGQCEIKGNSWNGSTRYDTNPDGNGYLDCPEAVDTIRVSASNVVINSVLPSSIKGSANNLIAWINVTSGGSGYIQSSTNVVITDTTSSGVAAVAIPFVYNGVIIGVAVTNGGYNYDPSHTSISFTGVGTGAAANAQIGLPLPANRSITIQAQNGAKLLRSGTKSYQLNAMLNDLVMGPQSTVTLSESFGSWMESSYLPGFNGTGVMTVSTNISPTGNPPTGQFYIYIDQADNKLKARGASGTITILAIP